MLQSCICMSNTQKVARWENKQKNYVPVFHCSQAWSPTLVLWQITGKLEGWDECNQIPMLSLFLLTEIYTKTVKTVFPIENKKFYQLTLNRVFLVLAMKKIKTLIASKVVQQFHPWRMERIEGGALPKDNGGGGRGGAQKTKTNGDKKGEHPVPPLPWIYTSGFSSNYNNVMSIEQEVWCTCTCF